MSPIGLPPGAWNCHTHVFDPETVQLKSERTYTPQAAPLDALLQHALADCIMLVQASIEDGTDSLLQNLQRCRQQYPSTLVRGTIFADPDPARGLANLDEVAFDRLHEAGVRSIRIHGFYGGSGNAVEWVQEQFRNVAALGPIRKYGWSISAQLPLKSWSTIATFLRNEPCLSGVPIVADHNGGADPCSAGSRSLRAYSPCWNRDECTWRLAPCIDALPTICMA